MLYLRFPIINVNGLQIYRAQQWMLKEWWPQVVIASKKRPFSIAKYPKKNEVINNSGSYGFMLFCTFFIYTLLQRLQCIMFRTHVLYGLEKSSHEFSKTADKFERFSFTFLSLGIKADWWVHRRFVCPTLNHSREIQKDITRLNSFLLVEMVKILKQP